MSMYLGCMMATCECSYPASAGSENNMLGFRHTLKGSDGTVMNTMETHSGVMYVATLVQEKLG